VRHQNSVFREPLKLIPWRVFDRLVDEHGSDELVRKFKTRHQLIALLYGQLAGACSLREIEATMASHQGGFITSAAALRGARPLRMPIEAAVPWCSPNYSSTCWAWRRARFGAR
jgi:hypothetical protein